ncbi:LysE family translocator [Enterovibrio calviensis]|uniref:LysE family translocator n=1 Tax=Enterovibrio calviensis TaxID=91359 RepID=UPI00048A2963|nr:LysE family transporter [Enterovibrio calviensis]
MLEIFAYAIGIMYSPGPVNLLGLNGGIQGKTKQNLPYFTGVAIAMLILFVSLNVVGGSLVTEDSLPFVSAAGCGYILYIASKLMVARVQIDNKEIDDSLTFKDGLVLQLLNPKGLIATLPIVTIQFPAAGIHGTSSLFWIFVLSILAFGAPTSYSVIGGLIGRRIRQPNYFRVFNVLMALMLAFVAIDIFYQNVYTPWFK